MSLAEQVASNTTAELLAARRELKTLVIDVERLKGKFRWDDRYDGLVIEGEFWSLSDFKHKFGRIPHDKVTEWPRTICAAWRWIGEKKIHFAAEWENDAATFAQTVRDQLDKADIITGHYVNAADRKWLNSLFRDHRIDWPSNYRVVDTCTIARRDLGDESMTLDALCRRFGIPTKTGKYDAAAARAACEGDRKAQRQVKLYNCGDVDASTGLYFCTLPLAKGHPHVAPTLGTERPTCGRCTSTNVERAGTWNTGVNVWLRWHCRDCPQGSYFTTTFHSRGPSVRAL